jgi:DNA-binding response OmpR family regulator
MTKPAILLADNDLDFLKISQEFLERHGYRVIPVSDPIEAQHVLEQEPVALAILDFRLVNDEDEYDRSGLNLARDTIGASSVPKIILTRFDRYDYARESLRPWHGGGKAVAIDFVTKQEGLETLLESIRHALSQTKIFLCYARPDENQVRELYEKLSSAGFTPWMDKKCIFGGQKWEIAIRRAIREADFFVACISQRSINRRGFIQKEIRMALSIWDEKLEDDIYLIPIRLEDCEVTHERLRELQWIDMFRPRGFQKLVQAIRTGVERHDKAS